MDGGLDAIQKASLKIVKGALPYVPRYQHVKEP